MNLTEPVVGIDRGASFTDFAVVAGDQLIETRSIPSRGWQAITQIYEQLQERHRTSRAVFTGAAAGMPKDLADAVDIVAEIDAVGFGGARMAGANHCIVASVGTGTAVVHFKDNRAAHVGGTGIGGGTITGLAGLLCGTEDPAEIARLASEGAAHRINLTISDLGYEAISFLGADMTASNFAAVRSRRREDLAAGILSLVAETVGILASICAREARCRDAIVMVGKVVANRYIRDVLNLVAKLYQTTYIFPENPGVATVFGAVKKHQHMLMHTET